VTALTPTPALVSDGPRQLGSLAGRTFRLALGAGVALLVLSFVIAIATSMDLGRFMKSYLLAFAYLLTICLGALFFTMVQHITKAGWSVTIRRTSEAIAANLTMIWVLFLPIAFVVLTAPDDKYVLYSWMSEKKVAEDWLYQHKLPYLNEGFWAVRAVLFLAVWAGLGWFFHSRSVRQDADGDKRHSHAMQKWAPLGILLFALTLTFAAVDWIMALEAHWFSTMWGVYFFAMSATGFFATLPIVLYLMQRAGKIENDVTKEHFQDIGKLLFGFGVVFHAYIAFSQFMLLWYANIPETTGWFIVRTTGPWYWLLWLVPIGHFAIPFVLLISKHAKRAVPFLCVVAGWILVMHFVDLYLAVMPEMPIKMLADAPSLEAFKAAAVADPAQHLGWKPSLVDVTLVLAFLAIGTAFTARRLGQASLVPERDPRLHEALRFENM